MKPGRRGGAVRASGASLRPAGGCATSARAAATSLDGFKECIVNVAVAPLLARLERLDDGMLCLMKVLRRMLVLRTVATADVPARHAEAQVNPRVPDLQTILAPARARRDLVNL